MGETTTAPTAWRLRSSPSLPTHRQAGERHAPGQTRPERHRVAVACRRNERRGAAVVEFAVVAPLLLLLVLGTIEYGRFVMIQQMLTNAAREGARRATLEGASAADVVQVVSDYCADAGITGASTTVNPDPAAATPGTAITVAAAITFDQVS